MADDVLRERGNSLEEEFFRKQNAELVERMRSQKAVDSARSEMMTLSGVQDPTVIDEMIELGITPATFTALSLAPLVMVAWADGRLEPNERDAVLKESAKLGVNLDSPEYELLQEWLQEPPSNTLLEAWTQYGRSLSHSLHDDQRREFRDATMRRAEAVADATGGLAGFGKRSPEEKRILSAIESALVG